MKKVIANFKMNKTPDETMQYFINFLPRLTRHDIEVGFCLPYTSLAIASFVTRDYDVKIGAQNICDVEEGGCTGEISGKMLSGCGVEYVIVGHSERRKKFKENSAQINKKIKIALKNQLRVVLCVGEDLADNNILKTKERLKEQIENALKGLYENELERVIIAYEPVWAIGTGKSATCKEIEEAIKIIRRVIADDFSKKAGEEISVIYGGSVNLKNIGQISKIKGLDGVLVGGACLDPAYFNEMISSITLPKK